MQCTMPCTMQCTRQCTIYHVMLQAVLLRLKREMASYEQAGRVWLRTRVSGRAHPKPKPIPSPSPSPSPSASPNLTLTKARRVWEVCWAAGGDFHLKVLAVLMLSQQASE